MASIDPRARSALARVLRWTLLAALAATLPARAGAGETWQALPDTDLRIRPGSALDFTGLFGSPDAIETRVGVDAAGHLALEGGRGERIRFLCAPLVFHGPHGGLPDHATADALARQLRMRGYNLARFHFVDAALMQGREHDFDYDPEQVDRFHYLLAALKREGVRWMIDAATSWNGAYGGVEPHRFARVHNLHVDVHFDPGAQAHWRRMVDTILAVENPYTGRDILEDPALTVVTLLNEGGLGFQSRRGYPPALRNAFQAWLREHHPEADAERIPGRWESSAQAARMQRFLTEVEKRTAGWMTRYMREAGYRGLVTAYNNGKTLQAAAARAALELVSIHGYYDLPSDFARPGSRQRATSAVADALPYVGYFATSRYLGRPFIVDEYDHPYWSPWRREAGLAVPAYAALQGWDGICRFNDPVVLRYDREGPPRTRAIYPFGIGMDPVAHAGETLAALLYRRGDVAASPHRVAVDTGAALAFGARGGVDRLPADLRRLSLLAGAGVRWDPGDGAADVAFDAEPGAMQALGADSPLARGTWSERLRALRRRGILEANNATDAGDLYESDTGQVRLSPQRRELRVRTPRTEAALFDGGLPLSLGRLTIESADAPALVALSSLDGRELARSRRMLLIVATDAVNSGARFADGRRTLQRLGRLPVRLRSAELTLRIARTGEHGFALYPLGLNGARQSPLPVSATSDALRVHIDTREGRTTPFFELTRNSERSPR